MSVPFVRNWQYFRFSAYGFLKNLRFFEPFLMLFLLEKGLGYLQIGTLYAIREISINIMEIPTGIIADALGRRRSMMISFLGYIASFIIFYFSASYAVLVLAMLLFSVGEAFRTGTHKAMILSYLEFHGWQKQKVHYYGHTRSWSQMGSALVAIPAALVVFFTGNYKIVFILTVIPYILNLVNMAFYPSEVESRVKQLNDTNVWQKLLEVSREMVRTFKNRRARQVTLNLGLYFGFFKAIKDYWQPLLLAIGISIPFLENLPGDDQNTLYVGIAYFLVYLATSLVSRYSGRITEALGDTTKTTRHSLFVAALLAFMVAVAIVKDWPLAAALLFAGFFILQNLQKPIGTALMSEVMKEEVFATGLSIQSQVDTFFSAILAVVIGAFADKFGIGAAMVVSGALLALGNFVFRIKK